MNRRTLGINRYILWGSLAVALVLIAWLLPAANRRPDTGRAASRTERILARRVQALDGYISTSLSADRSEWIGHYDLPKDMVIYRYIGDTLQSWCNQFPVRNDDIAGRVVFQRISRPRESLSSPLAEVGEDPIFVNYGPKWYLVKAVTLGPRKVIAGLEILNSMDEDNAGGANPRLHLGRNYSIVPLSENGGSVVRLDERPVFKIISNSITGSGFWGESSPRNSRLFSPTIYADGQLFNSLGAVLVTSAVIFLAVCIAFTFRRKIYRRILKSSHVKGNMAAYAVILILVLAGVLIYTHFILRSIILNSSITLELYRINDLSRYTFLVYVMLTALLMTVPLLVQMMVPALNRGLRFNADPYSAQARFATAAMFAAYLVLMAGTLGFRKEKDRINVLANRLSMERNISLELELRMTEEKIAADQLVASLCVLQNSDNIILGRIVDNYMFNISKNNDILVELFPENEKDQDAIAYFTQMVSQGTPIADGSRFRFRRDAGGRNYYTGSFAYYYPGNGVTMMLLTVSPKSNREDRGYASILGYSAPGDVLMPANYSFAKYSSSNLVSYTGNYAYPTVLDVNQEFELLNAPSGVIRINGYTHFINSVSDEDLILISRQKTEDFLYVVAFLFLTLIFYFCLSLISLTRPKPQTKEKNYYKSRINAAMMLALVMTLITLTTVSVLFVYRRNNANLRSSMADKVNSLQTLLEARCRFAQDYTAFNTQEASNVLEDISNTMKSDITLYTTDGKEFRSTTPEVFERMLLGSRINQDAFENLIYKNRRYYIGREDVGPKRTWLLYAPVFNGQGKMIAIMGSPFTDGSFDFKSRAVIHSVTLITVFMFLLLLARFLMERAVEKMFKPISEIGRKMNEVDINNLEYIVYERDDEVSTLVRAYNLMVHDLYNSTKQLTQAERDKAWATMARQVAHEIKNPLTPIKLQIQRLIRMKANGNPAWSDRFDEISQEVLAQIDILADTANEFLTFAKLYTEEPVDIDLDKLLKEQIDLFDSRDNIIFSYMGLSGATVTGPKPQLTRVFVNLLGNSVQAIENFQNESRDKGDEPVKGRITVSLRLSSKEGFYDIVFEDNGPGVSDEHRAKLFTPNFTTKSNGTGLGLAICRNIIEKCNGEILYSKSFSLKGACFTVRYPKKK